MVMAYYVGMAATNLAGSGWDRDGGTSGALIGIGVEPRPAIVGVLSYLGVVGFRVEAVATARRAGRTMCMA